MKLWTGRLDGSVNAAVARLNDSLPFDQRIALQDVQGSVAWAHALERAGVLIQAEAGEIERGLTEVAREFNSDQFVFEPSDEDIHTAVERRLTELIGPLGGKLHTGRSRNDQVTTDFRLWVLQALGRLDAHVRELQSTLVVRAQRDRSDILPGYTHLQRAQPILLSHWWLSHFWAFQRDRERLRDVGRHTRVMPLGSGALAGAGFAIDRVALAHELGFDSALPNSLDAVSDRDYCTEYLFCTALLGIHLSRLAEALILYSTAEFGFIELDDAYSTGSSLMPQKKNPDPLELIRAKSGKLIGLLTGLLATLKALPSAYDKDLQEDKPAVFEATDTLELALPVMSGAIATLSVRAGQMRAAVDDQMLATDLADYLVERGVPFREAHGAAGHAVARAAALGVTLSRLAPAEYRAIQPAFGDDVYQVFDLGRALGRRAAAGGTAPQAVEEQIKLARAALGS